MTYMIGHHDTRELEEFIFRTVESDYNIQINRNLKPYTAMLTERWYDEWYPNNVDFYQDPAYVSLAVECLRDWTYERVNQSVSYLRHHTLYEPRLICDFGAGVGLSTLMLAEVFPDATVAYCDVSEYRARVLRQLMHHFNIGHNVEIFRDIPRSSDVICAFDVFEHFKKPLEPLSKLLNSETRFIFDSSSFKYRAPGHFNEYVINDIVVDARNAKGVFYNAIKQCGYVTSADVHHVSYPSGRPTVFIRSDAQNLLRWG